MNIADYLKVYFIMGSNNSNQDPLLVLEQALKGGITLFQFREKGTGARTGQEKLNLAREMKKLCHQYDVPFVVNDDVELALTIEADGIHIGQEDEPVLRVRERCPARLFIGVSATNEKEAHQAAKDGADYIGVGPLFSTVSKEDAKTPIGLAGLSKINRLVGDVPTVAIGGIKLSDAPAIIQAGTAGVSVISAISQADSPEQAARSLKKMVEETRSDS